MVWFLAAIGFASATPPTHDCLTLELLPEAGPLMAPTEWRLNLADKGQRDAFNDDFPNQSPSDNFVIKWGNSRSISNAAVAALTEAFEEGWTVLVTEMEHIPPPGSSDYRMNIYVGDTGSGAPASYGTSGYFTLDPEGWPMIVINPDIVDYHAYAQKVAVHEFYHSTQYGAERFSYDGLDAWYWEATANWASGVVYPDSPEFVMNFLGVRLLFPHYPADFFDYPDEGLLQEYYQYGAFILPWYMTETLGDWSIVRDTWTEWNGGRNPLESLRNEVEERGEDFNTLWLEHAAMASTQNFPSDWDLEPTMNELSAYSEYNNLIARTVPASGDTDWVQSDASLAIHRYGFNTLRLTAPDPGTLAILVKGETNGSKGSIAQWGALVTVVTNNTEVSTVMPFAGSEGGLELTMFGSEDEVWLTVGAWTDNFHDTSAWDSETYGYATSFQWVVPEENNPPLPPNNEDDVELAGGCGCQSPLPIQSTAVGILWGLFALLFVRRRAVR